MEDKIEIKNREKKQIKSDDILDREIQKKFENQEENKHLPALNSLMMNYAGTRPGSH